MESAYVCPHCQQTIQIIDPQPEQIVVCPHCERDFLLPAELTPAEPEPSTAAGEELDALRIRQLSLMRRATYRSRSYAIIAACACTVAVAQLVVMSLREMRSNGFDVWITGYALLAVIAFAGAWYSGARALREEQSGVAKQMGADSDASSYVPDFTPLGDGSQLHENLNKIE